MNRVFIYMFALLSIMIAACGNPDVNLTDSGYEPKIVVEAYLFAGQTVQNIKVLRNYALGKEIDLSKMALTPTENSATVTINGTPLLFDSGTQTYYNSSITIEYGKTYKLEISATMDGQKLSTNAETTVPQSGFSIMGSKNLGNVSYSAGSIDLQYTPSVGASFYVFAFLPDSASEFNFIYDNPYMERIDTSDVKKSLSEMKTRYDCVANLSSGGSNVYTYHLDFFRLQFYSTYKTIVYAGDANYKNFLFSAESVQEMDGNFHEPVPVLAGDGIGVFASAIKDTLIFDIVE